MKKFILISLMFMGLAFTVSAQEQTKPVYDVIYSVDITDETEVIHPMYFIDRAGKKLLNYDPEDPVVIDNPTDYIPADIKSIKKEGNTETITFKQGQDPYEYKIVFTINPKLTSKDDLSSQTLKHYVEGQTDNRLIKIMNYNQLPDEEKQSIEYTRKYREQEAARKSGAATSNSGGAAKADEPETPEQKAKGGVKNILNKGKNLFKKKN